MIICNILSLKIISDIVVTLALLGCQKSPNQHDSTLYVRSESLSVYNFTNEYYVKIISKMPWESETDVEWITILDSEGEKGKSKIGFSVSENNEDERKGKIRIANTEASQVIQVVQESGKSAEFYVKKDGKGKGTSWEDATSLVNALDLASSGNTIHIAAGTYNPTETITGGVPADDGDLTFEISKYLTLKGGYPENAQEGATSDPKKHRTILSGQLPSGNETYHVVTITAPKKEVDVILDGLTISGGNASLSSTSITINNTKFRRDYGGGIIVGNSGVEIVNSEIINNNSAKFAAGLYIFDESNVAIRESKINDNHSDSNVGGIWVKSSTAYIYNTEINGNSGSTAAAVHGYPDATIYMYNSTMADNKGRSYGAAFYVRKNSKGILVNSLITNNESKSTNGGGGVMMYNNCEVDIISTTITDNKIAGPG